MMPVLPLTCDLPPVATMEARILEVRDLLGDQHDIDDTEIKETLWYYYFDVAQTVSWLLGSFLPICLI